MRRDVKARPEVPGRRGSSSESHRDGTANHSMRLNQKVALITGGTSGIGEATAILFAKEGAQVAITGRSNERGTAVVERIKQNGGSAIFDCADVSLAADCQRAVGQTLEAFGRLDILFNNAGVFYPQTALECSEKEWDEQLDVNLKGTFLMSKFALPTMIARRHEQRNRPRQRPRGARLTR